jgi:hypothetical protein
MNKLDFTAVGHKGAGLLPRLRRHVFTPVEGEEAAFAKAVEEQMPLLIGSSDPLAPLVAFSWKPVAAIAPDKHQILAATLDQHRMWCRDATSPTPCSAKQLPNRLREVLGGPQTEMLSLTDGRLSQLPALLAGLGQWGKVYLHDPYLGEKLADPKVVNRVTAILSYDAENGGCGKRPILITRSPKELHGGVIPAEICSYNEWRLDPSLRFLSHARWILAGRAAVWIDTGLFESKYDKTLVAYPLANCVVNQMTDFVGRLVPDGQRGSYGAGAGSSARSR